MLVSCCAGALGFPPLPQTSSSLCTHHPIHLLANDNWSLLCPPPPLWSPSLSLSLSLFSVQFLILIPEIWFDTSDFADWVLHLLIADDPWLHPWNHLRYLRNRRRWSRLVQRFILRCCLIDFVSNLCFNGGFWCDLSLSSVSVCRSFRFRGDRIACCGWWWWWVRERMRYQFVIKIQMFFVLFLICTIEVVSKFTVI